MMGCEKFSYQQGRSWFWRRRKGGQVHDISSMIAAAMAYDQALKPPRARPGLVRLGAKR